MPPRFYSPFGAPYVMMPPPAIYSPILNFSNLNSSTPSRLEKAIVINIAYCNVLDLVDSTGVTHVVTAPKIDPSTAAPSGTQKFDVLYDTTRSEPDVFYCKFMSSTKTAGSSGTLAVTVYGVSQTLLLDTDTSNDTSWKVSRSSQAGAYEYSPASVPVRISRDIGGMEHFWTAAGSGSQTVQLLPALQRDIGSQLWCICRSYES